MTAKDLHFSFDDALAQSRAAAAAETGISGMQAQERSAPVTPLRGGGRRTRGGDRHPAWIVTGLTKDWDFYELLLPQILILMRLEGGGGGA